MHKKQNFKPWWFKKKLQKKYELNTHTIVVFFVLFLCLCTSDARSSVCFKEDEKLASQVGWGQCDRGKLVVDDDVAAKLTCEACCYKVGHMCWQSGYFITSNEFFNCESDAELFTINQPQCFHSDVTCTLSSEWALWLCMCERQTCAPQSFLLWMRAHWGTITRKETRMTYQLLSSHGSVRRSGVYWPRRSTRSLLVTAAPFDFVCGRRHIPTVPADWRSKKWPQQQTTLIWATRFPGFDAHVD